MLPVIQQPLSSGSATSSLSTTAKCFDLLNDLLRGISNLSEEQIKQKLGIALGYNDIITEGLLRVYQSYNTPFIQLRLLQAQLIQNTDNYFNQIAQQQQQNYHPTTLSLIKQALEGDYLLLQIYEQSIQNTFMSFYNFLCSFTRENIPNAWGYEKLIIQILGIWSVKIDQAKAAQENGANQRSLTQTTSTVALHHLSSSSSDSGMLRVEEKSQILSDPKELTVTAKTTQLTCNFIQTHYPKPST